ncbi:MAG: hypothetical protein AAGA30_02605 [Planctomycetota bacterium]
MRHWLRLFVALRYQILGGLILGVLLPSLPLIGHPTLEGIYQLDHPVRLSLLTFVVFTAASMTTICFTTTFLNIGERLSDENVNRATEKLRGLIHPYVQLVVFLIMALPLPLIAYWYTSKEIEATPSIGFLPAGAYFGIGAGAAILFIWLIAWLERRFCTYGHPVVASIWQKRSTNTRRESGFGDILDKYLELLGPGFVDFDIDDEKQTPWSRPGHVLLLLYTCGLILTYFAGFAFLNVTDENSWLSMLFFIVLLITMAIAIMSFLAFFFDRFSVPPSAILALWIVITAFTNDYHEFDTNPASLEQTASIKAENELQRRKTKLLDKKPDSSPNKKTWQMSRVDETDAPRNSDETVAQDNQQQPVALAELVQSWKQRQSKLAPNNRDLIIVTAAGGGIQASGWTSQVLTELHRATQGEFSRSIFLISAVSGGSVATMMHAVNMPDLLDPDIDAEGTEKVLNHIHRMSTESNLAAAGWGLAFPDTCRMVIPFSSHILGKDRDRGYALEAVWRSRMYSVLGDRVRDKWRLSDLAKGIRANNLPGIVFNAFLIDTGQRLLISPCLLSENLSSSSDRENLGVRYVEYSQAAGLTLPISTAARLSATFPYITPTATPKRGNWQEQAKDKDVANLLANSHIGDGGYTDNEGILTALDYIRAILRKYNRKKIKDRGFRDIILVRIAPFPLPKQLKRPKKSDALSQSYLGPAFGIYNGRVASQAERGDWEIDRMLEFPNKLAFQERKFQEEYDKIDSFVKLADEFTNGKADAIHQLDQSLAQSEDWIRLRSSLLEPVKSARQDIDNTLDTLRLSVRNVDQVDYIQIHEVTIDFHLEKEPPLSWRLSVDQRADLVQAWNDWKNRLDSKSEDKGFQFLIKRLTSTQ